MERFEAEREIGVSVPIPDSGFKPASNHRFIMEFAKKRGGVYDLEEYGRYIKAKMPEGINRDRAILWNATAVRKLCGAGYLIPEGRGKYRLNPIIPESSPERRFTVGENHRKLMRQNTGGILRLSDIKDAHRGKPEKERCRQNKIIDGMVKNLAARGYLEHEGRGVYRLTAAALTAISEPQRTRSKKSTSRQGGADIKITAYDRYLTEISDNGHIDKDKLSEHEKAESLTKRIQTLEKAGLIKDNILTPQLIEQIGVAVARSRNRSLSMDKLTEGQRQTLADMRVFLNLSFEQIARHIYRGDADAARRDIRYMTDTELLVKDREWNVYALGKRGIRLINSIEPNQVRYATKLFSRREEVGHDMLVYSAYKSFEAKLKLKGMEVTALKNDRQMRSEDAQKYGNMIGNYPDLRVEYRDPVTGRIFYHDIELDCGYDERTVSAKLDGLLASGGRADAGGKTYTGVSWVASGARQALKVARIASEDKSKRLTRTKHLMLYSMDDNMNIHKVKWW